MYGEIADLPLELSISKIPTTVRNVQGWYEKSMVRNVYGTNSLWYEKSGNPNVAYNGKRSYCQNVPFASCYYLKIKRKGISSP